MKKLVYKLEAIMTYIINFESKILKYNKLILEKVSFDKRIFWKEYRKSIGNLTEPESLALRLWVIEKFGCRGKIASKTHC